MEGSPYPWLHVVACIRESLGSFHNLLTSFTKAVTRDDVLNAIFAKHCARESALNVLFFMAILILDGAFLCEADRHNTIRKRSMQTDLCSRSPLRPYIHSQKMQDLLTGPLRDTHTHLPSQDDHRLLGHPAALGADSRYLESLILASRFMSASGRLCPPAKAWDPLLGASLDSAHAAVWRTLVCMNIEQPSLRATE